jgi:hypothetical protein
MRGGRLVRVTVMAAVATVLMACGDAALGGPTWKGDTPVGDGMTLKFTSDTECTMGVLGPNGAHVTYTVSDDQVTVSTTDDSYVFTRDGDKMTGGGANPVQGVAGSRGQL